MSGSSVPWRTRAPLAAESSKAKRSVAPRGPCDTAVYAILSGNLGVECQQPGLPLHGFNPLGANSERPAGQPSRHETFPSHNFHPSAPTCSVRLNIMENEALFQIGPCLVEAGQVADLPEGLVIVTSLARIPLPASLMAAPHDTGRSG